MMGIREPRPDNFRPVAAEEIDLVLVPGVAFDLEGNRVGYGAGYYDRFLPSLRKDALIVGIAFSCQLFDKFDREEHDVKMALLITEKGILNLRQPKEREPDNMI
jgi:5-formyltetrahydrofolate cyclo-ligase